MSGFLLDTHVVSELRRRRRNRGVVEWLEENLGIRGLDIPAEPNTTLGRIPAVRVDTAQSPQAFAYADIFFLKENLLFQISMLDTNNELNQDLYETLIASFEFTE